MAAGDEEGAVMMALFANGGIAIAKFTVGIMSGSAAMLAEAWHSVADTGNQAFLLLGIRSSERPPDERHPFGYGKDQFFWAFVVAISLFTLGGLFSFQHGIEKLSHMGENGHGAISATHLLYNGIVIIVAIFLESLAFRKAWNALRKMQTGSFFSFIRETKSVSLVTVFFEDLAALTGLFIAGAGTLLTYLTGSVFWDGVASITIGVLLGVVAVFLAYETRALLLGERASNEVIQYIEMLLDETGKIRSHRELRTMQVGPSSVLAAVRINVPDDIDAKRVELITDKLQEQVKDEHPQVRHLYIELEDEAEPPETDQNEKDEEEGS